MTEVDITFLDPSYSASSLKKNWLCLESNQDRDGIDMTTTSSDDHYTTQPYYGQNIVLYILSQQIEDAKFSTCCVPADTTADKTYDQPDSRYATYT